MVQSWLVMGLGNPGAKYSGNRHNIGYRVVEELARRGNENFVTHKARAQVCQLRLGVLPGGIPGPKVVLAKSATYMNLSGGPTAALAKFFSIPPENILVVHDELDLPAHTLRLKKGGGEGGHNGLRSISGALCTRDYIRLRMGIGRPAGSVNPADFVLSDFPLRQAPEWELDVALAADVVEELVVQGLEKTTMRLHTSG